ncbi:hypothetical protein RRG08_037467 [Elysia crispata]|uniref:Uncharacterized protein n=1 Tax=Elysia crispata TaxID=231223 RepID=A0AAE1B0H6_9GAST|nr:hypothetical protein RRG08_037467 [Elysia crispata]
MDEALCHWRGLPQMRAYMRDKPIKSDYVVELQIMAHKENVSNRFVAVCQQLIDAYIVCLLDRSFVLRIKNDGEILLFWDNKQLIVQKRDSSEPSDVNEVSYLYT